MNTNKLFFNVNKYFDNNRKDNSRTGTQGPPGAAGPQGLQGIQDIQGPIGPNGTQCEPSSVCPSILNNTALLSCIGPLDGTSPFESNAVCDEGDSAISRSSSWILIFLRSSSII